MRIGGTVGCILEKTIFSILIYFEARLIKLDRFFSWPKVIFSAASLFLPGALFAEESCITTDELLNGAYDESSIACELDANALLNKIFNRKLSDQEEDYIFNNFPIYFQLEVSTGEWDLEENYEVYLLSAELLSLKILSTERNLEDARLGAYWLYLYGRRLDVIESISDSATFESTRQAIGWSAKEYNFGDALYSNWEVHLICFATYDVPSAPIVNVLTSTHIRNCYTELNSVE